MFDIVFLESLRDSGGSVAAPACLALADHWGVGCISFLASWGLGGLVGLGLVATCMLCLTVLPVAI